jgi:nitrite reductase (cytochrome c-552)
MKPKFSLASIPTAAYLVIAAVLALLTVGVLLLMQNITQRQVEGRQDAVRVVQLTEDVVDPAVWGQDYPHQYDSYKRTADIARTRYGGSEAIQKSADANPVWQQIWNGYPFSVDFREDRGHAYMLVDQRETERVLKFKQPGACLNCHASVLPAYYQKGVEAGVPKENREAAIQKGFEVMASMPYSQATKLVEHPITCNDCHDPETMKLRITRPAFFTGVDALARSDYPLPMLPSIERWRAAGKQGTYNPNELAERQEMRTFVCAQCHVEYYFKGAEKILTYPWQKGLKAEQMEAYYDEVGWKDWVHKDTGAPALKAQHPEFELWSQGTHAAAGVACADCHMPYQRVGAVKVSSHHVQSPLLTAGQACQVCHSGNETDINKRVQTIQDRTRVAMTNAETAVVALINDIKAAKAAGVADDKLVKAQAFQRQAQWRLDYVSAENSMGFHAPQESMRLLGEAADLARQGQLEVAKLNLGPTAQK